MLYKNNFTSNPVATQYFEAPLEFSHNNEKLLVMPRNIAVKSAQNCVHNIWEEKNAAQCTQQIEAKYTVTQSTIIHNLHFLHTNQTIGTNYQTYCNNLIA